MHILRHVFLFVILTSSVACSKAIPTVTTLLGTKPLSPSQVDDLDPSINSGGGQALGPNYRMVMKIGGSGSQVLKGSRFRIHTSGDN